MSSPFTGNNSPRTNWSVAFFDSTVLFFPFPILAGSGTVEVGYGEGGYGDGGYDSPATPGTSAPTTNWVQVTDK